MAYQLPALPYAYDALEPHFDTQTMEIHHSKHHQAYVNNANAVLANLPEWEKLSAEELIARLAELPENVRTPLRNNAGGHANHSLFWQILKTSTTLQGKLKAAIERDFGSVEAFQAEFEKAAATRFGSGWAWLVVNKEGKLEVMSTANQDTPISEGKTPILGIDVWEHAYYVKYRNVRPDYIKAFFSVINWNKVNELYKAAK